MNIIEAAKFVEQGKKVRRKSWDTDTVVEWREDMVSIGKSNGRNFNLNELLADDWEIVEENTLLQNQPHVSKKYILQKHLPGVNAGHRFSPVSALAYAFIDNKRGIHIELANYLVENNPDWFQVEEKSPARLAFEEYCKIPRLTYAEINESLWNTAWYAAEEYFKSQK